MLKKKSVSKDNKRKHPQTEEQHMNRRRRCTESEESKDELADTELDRVGSDIEEGGLDLSVPFQPISAYAADRRQMLDQCFHVLGEKKLHKMLPDELKDCSIEKIKNLCWEQLEQLSLTNLLQILGGEDMTSEDTNVNTEVTLDSQQDNNVDSTSSLRECVKAQDPKQECVGSGEESDVLSINADTYDSDIEVPKEEQPVKSEDITAVADVKGCADATGLAESSEPVSGPGPAESLPPEAKDELEMDIDKSVSEILAASSASGTEAAKELGLKSPQQAAVGVPVQSGPSSGTPPAACQPSFQQLELLELEMRARAIKALMKASDGKKT